MIAHTLDYSGRYLARLQSQVTGNPAALRGAAEAYEKYADACVNAACDLDLVAAVPEEIWAGWAADAFRLVTRPVSRRATGVTQATFKEMAAALYTAADALERAQRSMDLHVAHFNHAASQYRSAATTATPVAAVKLFFTVTEQCSWWRVAGAEIAGKLAAELRDVARRLTQAADTADAAAAASAPRLPQSPHEAGVLAAEEVSRALRSGSRDELLQSLIALRSTMDRVRAAIRENRQVALFDGEYQFLQAFYDQLGFDLLSLPNTLHGSDLKAIGDGIMVLSRGPGTPSVVTSLLARPGFEGLEGFKATDIVDIGVNPENGQPQLRLGARLAMSPQMAALGEIVAASSLTPGQDLAMDMAKSASAMAAIANASLLPTATHQSDVSATLDHLVTAASRNHEAMAEFFKDGHAMRDLLAYDWPDDWAEPETAPVAKMFNWIATPEAGEEKLALEAYVTLTDKLTADDVYVPVAKAAMETNPTLSAEFASISRRYIDLYAKLNTVSDTSMPVPPGGAVGMLVGEGPGGISLRDAERMLMLGAFSEEGVLIQASAAADYGPARLGEAYRTADGEARFDQAGREAANVAGMVAATEWNAKWFRSVYDAYQHNRQLLDEFYPSRQETAAIGTASAYVGNVATNFIRDAVIAPGTKAAGSPWTVLFSLAPYAANAFYQGGIATPELRMPEVPTPAYGRIQLDVPDAALHLAAHHVALNKFPDLREANQYNPLFASRQEMEDAVSRLKQDPYAKVYMEAFDQRVAQAYQTFISIRAGAPAIVQQMFGRKPD